jgi:3-oxoacyl-[acyl-carrier protein] reductase
MKYGLNGKKAIVCASSRGLGKGCALALAKEGVDLVINGRDEDVLSRTGEEIRRLTGVRVRQVAADVATPEGRARILDACPDPDILVTNGGGPGPGSFMDWTSETWIKALEANMLAPIELIRASVGGMIDRRFGRIVNITSSAVKAPIGILGLSNGARGGLTCFISGLAREVARHNVTINNLLPGAFDTDRRASVIGATARATGQTAAAVRAAQIQKVPAQRFGGADEFGAACAFLCSEQAGFIVGQNLLLDGGEYPGVL